MTKTFGTRLAAAALALAVSGTAQAIPLSDLFQGGSIQAGDKLFDQWELLSYDATDGRSFDATNIDVTALDDGGLDPGPGLNFNVSNGELSIGGDGIFAFVDLMFGFRVTVLEPALFVKDASLAIVESAIDANPSLDAGVFILELLDADSLVATGDPGDADLGTMEAEVSLTDGVGVDEPTSAVDFPPRKSLFVTKNVLVWASDPGETAGLFQFQQRFSQIERTTSVPEPGTLALSLLALGGIGAMRRRRQAA